MNILCKHLIINSIALFVLLVNPTIEPNPNSPDMQGVIAGAVPKTHKVLWTFGAQSANAASPNRAVWTSTEITNSNKISVDGQYALFRMCSRSDISQNKDSTSILTAIIDEKTLSGIYQVNYEVPALRARDHLGKGWWDLIPKGEDSTCVEPVENGKGNNAPMIVYRKEIGPYKERVEQAILDAWNLCKGLYGLAERKSIPCVVFERPSIDLKNCSKDKKQLALNIYNQCLVNQYPHHAHQVCRKVCMKKAGEKMQWECMEKHTECSDIVDQRDLCTNYAKKHVVCP